MVDCSGVSPTVGNCFQIIPRAIFVVLNAMLANVATLGLTMFKIFIQQTHLNRLNISVPPPPPPPNLQILVLCDLSLMIYFQ